MSAAPAVDPRVAGTEGLPRRNGELVFEAPWEARAFGVAVAFCRRHGLDWDEFRQRLIAEIATGESGEGDWHYWERWVASLERLVLDRGLVSEAELEARVARIAHDVEHEHDHHHDHHHHE